MLPSKLTLARLESLLLTACDDLCASNLYEQRREEIRKEGQAAGLTEVDISLNLEDVDQYFGKYFYIPPRASLSLR